ncbi:zinc finger E-box-binding homeobox 2-like [Ochlerotatus camptorhynchus]|uniref:zinc finger E-box-binding homeobox 2-like n=1 Tax=Ochlerotatus camptorhynchus TaxID=644619 RepID=UPI0031D74B84
MSLALNFERKCRTCGTDILELTCGIPIFGSGLQLDHKIHRYLGLNVTLHDDLPKFLCATCFIKVESIDKFAILAKKTEEAYLGWFKCIRANLARHVNPIPPPLAPVQQLTHIPPPSSPRSSLHIPPKIDFSALKQAVDEQINQKDAPLGTALNPIRLIKPEISIVSYSDLKLGLLIKDQELLKLILKALRWAEHDQKATFEVLIQRLKNTTFREILSNPNLLRDSDLTQLLKSYIGQEAFNKFTGSNSNSHNGGSSIDLGNRGVTIKPIVHISSVKSNLSPSDMGSVSCSRAMPMLKKEHFSFSEDSVTQMEVGVDPSLFFDDEETQTKPKPESTQKMDSVVTIQLVPVNLANKKSSDKMIPAILKCDVRSNGSQVCSSCPKSFTTSTELQNHVVTKHLIKPKKSLSEAPAEKKVIKIRVKKNKDKTQLEPSKPPIPLSAASIPITIPPTTTITVIPAATKPSESKIQIPTTSVPSSNLQKPTAPTKVQTVKPKRKRDVKWTLKIDASLAKRTRSQVSLAKHSKLSCTVCRKRFPSKSKLSTHMESHGPKDNYTCEKCDRVFRTASNLAKHRQFHGGEKFSCDRCRRVYATSSMLKAHKITHSDARPHRCTICEKTFKRNQDLKFHLNQHTGARPFKCPQCPKSFASSGNCFAHRKRMHPAELSAAEEKDAQNSKPGRK